MLAAWPKLDLPKALDEAPKALDEAPKVLDEAPNVLDEPPKVLDEAPKALEALPKLLDPAPNALEDAPNALDEAPNAPGELPNAVETFSGVLAGVLAFAGDFDADAFAEPKSFVLLVRPGHASHALHSLTSDRKFLPGSVTFTGHLRLRHQRAHDERIEAESKGSQTFTTTPALCL